MGCVKERKKRKNPTPPMPTRLNCPSRKEGKWGGAAVRERGSGRDEKGGKDSQKEEKSEGLKFRRGVPLKIGFKKKGEKHRENE